MGRRWEEGKKRKCKSEIVFLQSELQLKLRKFDVLMLSEQSQHLAVC